MPASERPAYVTRADDELLYSMVVNVRAEVVAIGDELTSGQRVDTNSAWISQRLAEIGVSTSFHTTVADDLPACVEVFRLAGIIMAGQKRRWKYMISLPMK